MNLLLKVVLLSGLLIMICSGDVMWFGWLYGLCCLFGLCLVIGCVVLCVFFYGWWVFGRLRFDMVKFVRLVFGCVLWFVVFLL